jgi:hypothetical protein
MAKYLIDLVALLARRAGVHVRLLRPLHTEPASSSRTGEIRTVRTGDIHASRTGELRIGVADVLF